MFVPTNPPTALLDREIGENVFRNSLEICRRQFAPELPEARLEDAALHVDIGLQLLLAPLELGRDIGEPALDPLRSRIADVRELLGEHRLGLASEVADGPVELAREALRRVLAGAS